MKIEEINKESTQQKKKIDNLRGKKLALKSNCETLTEENKFKDFQLKKLEEDLSNLSKEYLELNGRLQNVGENKMEINNDIYELQKRGSMINFNFSTEIKALTEEKNSLLKDNILLTKRIENLEVELRNKFVPKQESDKKITQLESERNTYSSKLKIVEMNLDKHKKNIQHLKVENDELKKELEKTEKKFDHLSSHTRNYTSEIEFKDTPLNLLLDDDEQDEDKPQTRKKTVSKLKMVSPRNNTQAVSEFKVKTDEQTPTPTSKSAYKKKVTFEPKETIPEENEHKKSIVSSFDNSHTLFNELKKEDYLNNSNNLSINDDENITPYTNKVDLKITSNDIVNRMSNNEFVNFTYNKGGSSEKISIEGKMINIENINLNINQNNNNTGGKSRRSLNADFSDDIYKEFFLLTYQALKLNTDNIEPFLYVIIYQFILV